MTSVNRSAIMRAVKDRDTKPEMMVRRMVHAMGYRYRLHRNDLPGKPDLAFFSSKKIIFVHGCFWHGHHCARGARVPKTNRDYWKKKITRNYERDQATHKRLLEGEWDVLTIWECELKCLESLQDRLEHFLDPK